LLLLIVSCDSLFWEPLARGASQLIVNKLKLTRTFPATGVVRQVGSDNRSVVIAHDAITNYMKAMTMPFNVRNATDLQGVQSGDRISFLLHVNETESWIDHISRIGKEKPSPAPPLSLPETPRPHHPLMDYAFTNELGKTVTLSQFHGQALAITFFFTRCPIPDFCPRLSKNFEEASRKLSALPNGPTNWHFLSVTFDPEFDAPSVLKNYAERYNYDPKHWSFITGPTDKIQELAAQSEVSFQRDSGLFNHNFRTLIIDAAGHLQMVFPTSGDLSDAIVSEIIKAAAVTNRAS
jgi:protein SCO1/2